MGWYLENVYEIKLEAPYTFYVPSKEVIDQLKPGDIVKLIFTADKGKDGFIGERMWVEITERTGHAFKGELNNEPFIVESLELGTEIAFGAENICDTEYEDPWAEDLDAYFDTKVLVSNDVLERKEFNFLLRDKAEEPEDSGWTIMTGFEDEEELNDPEQFHYIAIGVVLNMDASILSFVHDEPLSAYERNGEGRFEKVEDYDWSEYLEN